MRAGWIGDTLSKTVYRQKIRGLVPEFVRSALRKTLTKPANNPKVNLSEGTRAQLRSRLSHVAGDLNALGVNVDHWPR